MKRAILMIAAVAALAAPASRADYAVLRSGLRLHITGYEISGDRVRLTVDGGLIEVPADSILSVEHEDLFPANPPEPPPTGPFGTLIRAAAEKHGVDEKLISHLIAVESNFNPRATSRKQALGLMQLLPRTAARFSVANVFDPAQNIDAGTRYLKEMLDRFSGNLPLALAAYNAGPEMVERYRGVPPFPETQKYVRQITARLAQDKSATNK
ncbi:MAG TPA: lytic transglycosylase domain-containing protein [Candidatus Limnocylindrales bacterium]|nr:lytic transglycosylase domain-containing protein [Candidatus Limnocylindrales bacterium]